MAWCPKCRTQQFGSDTCVDCGEPLQEQLPRMNTYLDDQEQGTTNRSARKPLDRKLLKNWGILLVCFMALVLVLRWVVTIYVNMSGIG